MRSVFRRASVFVVALMLGFATGSVRADDYLYGDEQLDAQYGLYGGDGYRLENDGNGFLIYGRHVGQYYDVVWHSSCDSESSGGCASGYGNHQPQEDPGDYAIMQADGNFVMYAYYVPGPAKYAVWATNTEGNSNAYLQAQNDANLVVYSQSQVPLWSIW